MLRLVNNHIVKYVALVLFCFLYVATQHQTFGANLYYPQSEEKGGIVVSATASPDSICNGQQSTLSASASLGTPPYTYSWDNGLGGGDTHTVTPSATTIFHVTVTDNLGFTSTDSVTVWVFDNPNANISASPNPICQGESSLLSSTPTSGTAPYSFGWDNGLGSGSDHTVSPPSDETYHVTVTDAFGCTTVDNITITVNDNPSASASVTEDSLCMGNSAVLNGTAAGGTSPYIYTWDNGLGDGQNQSVTPGTSTTYTLTVTDSNGCEDTSQVSIHVFDNPAVTVSASPSTICSGESTNLNASVSGGTAPYTYTWDNGLGNSASHFITPSDTTTYNLTVTDVNGCTSSGSTTVNVLELPIPTATATPMSLCENQYTDLSVTSTNGEAPYSYQWDHGLGVGANHTVFPTSTETYTVTVSDDNGCTASDDVTVTLNDLPTVTATATPIPVCELEPVTLDATGSGTTGPYSYFWDNGLGAGQTQTANPSAPTTYTVTVFDGNGCSSSTSVSVSTLDLPTASPTASPDSICPGGSSTLSVTGSDGLPPYSYNWNNGLGAGNNHTVSPGSSTTYTVTITDDNGCSSQADVDVITRELPTISITANPNPICDGGSSDITTTTSGGTSPFIFQWDNGIGNVQNPTVTPSSTTTYHLTVTDGNGCTTTDSITIVVSTSPSVTASASPNPVCEGETVNLSATGSAGTAPYTYVWDHGLGNGANQSITPSATDIYTVTVYDATGCSASDQVLVGVYDAPDIDLTADPNPICADEIVNLSASASGGTTPYSFVWDNGLGAGADQIDMPSVTTSYSATVTDANGCQDSASITLVVNENPQVDANASPNPICDGENSTLSASGTLGQPPYSFQWDHGLGVGSTHTVSPSNSTSYDVIISDDNGCVDTATVDLIVYDTPNITVSASDNPICPGDSTVLSAIGGGTVPAYVYVWDNGLGMGQNHTVSPASTTTYTATVQDGHGCTASDAVTVDVTNLPPANPTATPNPVCSGESVTLDVSGSGGTAPYTYFWDNGLGGGSTHVVNPTSTTTYSVTITDATGCTTSGSVTVDVNELPVLNPTATPPVICDIGSTTLHPNASGGSGPYSYLWSDGLGAVEEPVVSPTDTTTYSVTVTDSYGCSATDSITVLVTPLPTVTATAVPDTVCEGSPVTLSANASGTSGPYSYTWDQGLGTGQNQTDFPVNDITYTVEVVDANGCINTTSVDVFTWDLPVATPAATPNPICQGESSTLSVTGSDGNPPYTYNWSDGLGAGDIHVVSPASSESYTVTITDDNLCSSEANIDLTVNPTPSLSISATPDPLCSGDSATLTATPGGGVPPFTTVFDNGLGTGTMHTVSPAATTTYTATVTDDNGCSTTASYTLNVIPSPSVTATAAPDEICEGESSLLDASGSGGTPGYTYTWDNGIGPGQSHTINPDTTTNYEVIVSDVNGCTGSDDVTVTVHPAPTVSLDAFPVVVCQGGSATLQANASGGAPAYTYSWTPAMGGGDSHTVTPSSSTVYEVSVSDANTCTAMAQTIVTVNDTPSVTLTAFPDSICFGESSTLSTVVSGGTPNYTYYWSDGLSAMSSHTVSPASTNTYYVTVSDVNHCEGTSSATVTVNPEIIITTNVLNEPDCYGDTNGSFEIIVSGGTTLYDINWSNGTDSGSFNGSTGGPHTVNNVPSGSYTIDVTDNEGCTETHSFTLNQPDSLILNIDNVSDVSCFGNTDGAVDYTISGGTELFTLDWDNGSSSGTENNLTAGSHSLTNLEAGTYSLDITDANGCTASEVITIVEPPVLGFSVSSVDDISCFNGNDGVISVDVSGGTPTYSVQWDNGSITDSLTGISAGTHDITGLSAGTYQLTLTDASGCTATTSTTLNEPSTALDISIVSITDASCVGVDDGSAEVDANGGVSPYTYTWDHPNGSGTTITNVTAGDFNVTVTDAWGCEDSITVTIGQPADGLSATPDITPVTCASNSDGQIILNPAGGTTPYGYNWNPAVSTNDTAQNLSTGTYNVTIYDAGSCELELSLFVPVDPNTLTASITDTTHVSCNGGSDGEIVVTASNGGIPYSYSWDGYPTETTNTLSGLSAGSYEMTVTDSYNCEVVLNQTLNEPALLSITIDSISDVLCAGESTGAIYTTPQGGTPPYTYTWEEAGTVLSETGDDLINVPAGIYDISLTDSNNCGPATLSAGISEPASGLSVNISIDSLPSCPGMLDGGITATASGGTPPYNYIWDAPIAGNTAQSQTNLGTDIYSVSVTDDNGCTAESTITLNDPPSINLTMISEDVLCNGDSNGLAVVQASGGTPGYTYNWEDALGNPVSLDDSAQNLSAGTYFVTVTDNNGCAEVGSVTINEPTILNGSITHTDVSTWGNNDGTATANPSGGTSPYNYEWENDADPGNIISTDQTADSLYAGNYTLTITDNNGCIWIGSVTITEPNDPLGGTITLHQNVLCAPDSSGALTAQGYGATPPYSYDWENSSGTWSATGQSVTNLPAGTYYLTIQDDNGYTWDTTLNITQPPLLQITGYSITGFNQCNGDSTGAASISVAGGVPAYIYQWDDPSNSTTDNISNAPAGTYTVEVTDQNGCIVDTSITITEPDEIELNLQVTATPDCFGGSNASAASSVTGGTPGYNYQWENQSNTIVSLTDTLTGVPAGWYSLEVTDANGCTTIDSIEITEPPLLSGSITHTDASTWGNTDGSATVTPLGGTSPYSYAWVNDASPGDTISTEQTADSLAAGNYTVTVTDDNGCTWVGSVTIAEPNDPLGGIIITHQNILCAPDSTGALSAEAYGGTPGYTYTWENAGGTVLSDSAYVDNLPAGDYSLTIEDSLAYQWDTTVSITQPPLLEISATHSQPVSCYGGTDGIAAIEIAGGTPLYSITWQGYATTNDSLYNVPAGDYPVSVEDANGCSVDTIVTITQPDSTELDILITATPFCFGGNEGSLYADVSGGTPPHNFYWEDTAAINIGNTDSITGLTSSTYYLTLTDANGCVHTESVFIPQPDTLTTDSYSESTSGFGASDGYAWTEPDGGTPGYTYQWEAAINPGIIIGTNDSLMNQPGGNYYVTVTDLNGCTAIDTVKIDEPPELTHNLLIDHIQCYGDTTGGAWVQVHGGVTPYSYYWEDTAGNNIWNDSLLAPVPAGTYYVTITDANGYQNFDTAVVVQPPQLVFSTDSIQHVNCYGDSTAFADMHVSGGAPPYSYQWVKLDNPSVVIDTTGFITGIPAGNYLFTVMDDSTCVKDTSIIITQPDSIQLSLVGQANLSCYSSNNGYIEVEASGGTQPYSFTWMDSTMTVIASDTDSLGNLAAGNYHLAFTDANHCVDDSMSFSIIEPDPFVFNGQTDSVFCYGDATGAAELNPTGGTPAYDYLWIYEGDTLSGTNFPSIFNLEAGQYDIQVTDSNACVYDTTMVVPEPTAPITMDITITDSLLCYGGNTGEAILQISGGTELYDISYNNGAGDAGSLSDLSAGDYTLSNLESGTYLIEATDYYGCSQTHTFVMTEPPQLNIQFDAQNITCNGNNDGIIEAIVTGGTRPYSYAWDGGIPVADSVHANLTPGWHNLLVTDNNGCQILDSVRIYEPDSLLIDLRDSLRLDCHGDNNGAVLANITGGSSPMMAYWLDSAGDTVQYGPYLNNAGADIYYFTVIDDHGCRNSDTLVIWEPGPMSATLESFMTSCPTSEDGYAVIHMDTTGGTTPFSYDWDNPEHSVTDTAINLDSGWWHVTVTDANNCTYVDSVEVMSPDTIDMSFDIEPVQCNNQPGTVITSTTGGTPSYSYVWSTGHTSGIINDMPAGIHTVVVTDSHACTAAEQIIVESTGSIHPDIVVSSPVSCYGTADGSLSAIMNDGEIPFSFDWNTADTTQTITDLSAGIYAVEVTDNWGCVGTDTISLTQPDAITIDFQVQDVLCKNGNSGEVLAIAEGGNGNNMSEFTYSWNAGSFYGNPYEDLSEGYYSVVATDSEGCTGFGQVYVDEPDSAVYAIATTRNVSCYGYNNGKALAQGFGGTGPYDYQWIGVGNDTLNQQQTSSTLFPGNYTLYVTDQNGCMYDTIVKIYQPSPIYVSLSGYGSPTCDGLEDGWIELDSIIGGTPPYTLFINGAGLTWTQQNTFIDSVPAGQYEIMVHDANNCPQNNDAIMLTLAESDEDCIKVPAAFSPNGDGHNDVWRIDHLEIYRQVLIQVYNRWGQLLYEGGWNDDFWDGTYNGNDVPTGAYIYYIDLGGNNTKPLTGTVTVIR
jgi:gliding motility-associated-like protein